MKKKEFSFDFFTDELITFSNNENFFRQDAAVAKRYQTLAEMFDYFHTQSFVTTEFLDKFTMEEFEWFYDAISYWPTWESGFEAEDLDHIGIHESTKHVLMQKIASLQPVRKKVSFL